MDNGPQPGRETLITMSFSKNVASLVLAASIGAATLTPLSTAANARDWDRHGGDYSRDYRAGRDNDRDYGGRGGDRYEHRRDHHRHNGRNLAIGAFAAILGLAIASQASRDRSYDRYDRY